MAAINLAVPTPPLQQRTNSSNDIHQFLGAIKNGSLPNLEEHHDPTVTCWHPTSISLYIPHFLKISRQTDEKSRRMHGPEGKKANRGKKEIFFP